MAKLILILIFYFSATVAQSQANPTLECSDDFFYGTWKDTTTNLSGGMFEESSFGFIFGPDSCCSIFNNGKIIDCNGNTLKILYKVDCTTLPRQLDIEVFDLSTNSLKSALRFIFEIIDKKNIKIGTLSYPLYGKRPSSFNPDEGIDIKVLTKQ